MVSTQDRLKIAWLTGNEFRAYLELLRRGSISANDLSKKLSFDRTLTYQLLNNLTEKGFVSYIIKKNKKYFEASNPENLLNPIKEKEAIINDLIPELKKLEKVKEIAQEINIYEGKEGLRTLMREIINESNFCSFGSTGRAYEMLYEMPRITKQVERKGYTAKIITQSKYRNHKMLEHKNIKARYLDIDSEATTTIFGDKVSIHLIKEKPIIILIKNKLIADTYRNHFNFLWKLAKK